MDIVRIQESLGIVRRAAPVDLHGIAGFCVRAESDVERLIWEAIAAGSVKYRFACACCLRCAFSCLDAAITKRMPFTLLESHIHDIFGRVIDRDREGRITGYGRVCAWLYDFRVRIFTRRSERDGLRGSVSSLI